ncbi:discoidin domain-containing protein [Clostridium chauvoei]|nr:discoidin domain-containing protein [Clostridium chauvoei]MBX7308640.1 discoidin domain-containing protein [Clostridium chauvoei]
MYSKNTRKSKFVIPMVLACTIGAGLVSCSGGEITYKITEENETDLIMLNQPTSSHWFPEELLDWNPSEDKNLDFNTSVIPLAERIDKSKLTPVNETQNKDMNVVAISIMNGSTSGNPSQGTNKFSSNTFSYWQYIDKLVYWGGSSGEGLIVPPSPDVTDSAHKNGVPVLGTVFFPMTEHGGKLEWLDEFLKKDENGNFPMADKLIEVANTYNFDGWFINQETEGTKEKPINSNHSVLMQEFIKQFKEKSEGKLEIMWYDSMTKDGEMDWQNAITDKNEVFLIDGGKKDVADSMFLNFWWTYKKYADQELLKASNKKAEELGINPYDLYAGIDLQSNGTGTPVRWRLFEKDSKTPFTSLGLYCPSWTYFSSENVDEFEAKENRLWVNEFGNPAKATETVDREWRGISTYSIEQSVVKSLPFISNFNIGNGYNFFIDGEKVSSLDWNNRSLSDVMPTYRWIIENEGNNKLNAAMDFSTAYYGGNSIKLSGKLEANKESIIKLYTAELKLEKGIDFKTSAKSSEDIELDLVLEFEDGTIETVKADKNIGNEWTTVSYDVSNFKDKVVKTISYKVSSAKDVSNLILNLGNITIEKAKSSKTINVSKLKVDDVSFEEDNIYAGVRLSWNEGKKEDINHYEVYRIDKDKTKSFLGATVNNNFFVNTLKRDKNSDKTKFEVVAVNKNFNRGKADTVEIKWPENNTPTANFKVSKTLVAPGEKIQFENLSSEITENITWEFEGADVETSTENNPTVSYANEGTYSVKLTAKNKKGEDVKDIEGLITVTSKATEELKNLALNKETTASSFVNNNEAPKFAVDGSKENKWCAIGKAPHDITIDLGDIKTVSEVYIAHAEAGGESPDMNTKEYIIETSVDGENFEEVTKVTKNILGETVHAFKATEARYVKFTAVKPTQGSDSATRIYEIEVRGLDSKL